jgi:Fe-S-cluster containining protein
MKIHPNPGKNANNPDARGDASCITCGACCASFRVDFSLQECDDQGGRVPAGLADRLNDSLCRMRGTDYQPVRCAALTGKLGETVACGIYEWRPSPCREFEEGSQACQQARRRHNLPAL